MHAELQASWEGHHRSKVTEAMAPDARQRILSASESVQELCMQARRYLDQHVATVPVAVGCHGMSFRLARLSDDAAFPSQLDFVTLAMQPHLAKTFNPFLTQQAVSELHTGALRWLQLCVLQDRLQRIAVLMDSVEDNSGNDALLIRVRH